jgi:Histidine kinase-, DNA gyrase B-, and HSP90-like ATPase
MVAQAGASVLNRGFTMTIKNETAAHPELFADVPFAFGPGFLRDHAGHIMSDPRIALVELIANAYDAGASQVDIRWPDQPGGELQISDNGTGMTLDEFNRRWKTLRYNRSLEQGTDVQFPPGTRGSARAAFGQSGKGRHGAFCFADSYQVETWRDGTSATVKVQLVDGGSEPFHCSVVGQGQRSGHGTRIWATVMRKIISEEQIGDWVGSKFLVDPSFAIILNGRQLALLALQDLKSSELQVPSFGLIRIHQIEASQQDRTTRLRGITWWVNKRMVGFPSWSGLEEQDAILDGRTAAAKRVSFVVEADILKPDVKQDWSGFHDSDRSLKVRGGAKEHIIQALETLLSSTRKERKKAVLAEHRRAIGGLPILSRKVVGRFIDEVQQNCPSLSEGDLSRAVAVLTKLEASRDGYDLIGRLAMCSPDDLDGWNRLMREWTASNAETVLNELGRRLKLIRDLEKLVHVATSDELHDLQPLFARGLWMFGPELESTDFTSNRAMATVIRTLLGGAAEEVSTRRPDFVALPDRSIGVYSADSYDHEGEVSGIRKVIIVELKKGGFDVTTKELRQGEDYAIEIQKANLVRSVTKITVYVLGAKLVDSQERGVGESVRVIPLDYSSLLRRAHARTFHLQAKLSEAVTPEQSDMEVEEIVSQPEQEEFDV